MTIAIGTHTVIMTPTGPVEPGDRCLALTHGIGTLYSADGSRAVLMIDGRTTVCPAVDVRAIVDTQA